MAVLFKEFIAPFASVFKFTCHQFLSCSNCSI